MLAENHCPAPNPVISAFTGMTELEAGQKHLKLSATHRATIYLQDRPVPLQS